MILNCEAITKVQSVLLAAIAAVAAISGAAYFSLNPAEQNDPIKIGVCIPLTGPLGEGVWRAATLAAEQINAEGGVLGRNFTIVAEDDGTASGLDIAVVSNAMTKLITVDKANYAVTFAASPEIFHSHTAICAQNRVLLFTLASTMEEFSQQVLDDYEHYKYFFKLYAPNTTAVVANIADSMITLGKYSGFAKVALLYQDQTFLGEMASALNDSLSKRGFSVVYNAKVAPAVTDFTSYLASIDASGAQILLPLFTTQASIPLVREWSERESPYVVAGMLIGGTDPAYWGGTGGKCQYVGLTTMPFQAGYDLTNKSAATRSSYLERWGAPIPSGQANATYDGIRFILPDAIKRAGTAEAEAVIEALETIDVETSLARHFVYTNSHDLMRGPIGSENIEMYMLSGLAQWQSSGTLVPVSPERIMVDAGASYVYPPWSGPWSK